jgi:hypothetical protein
VNNLRRMDTGDLIAFVQTALRAAGVETVLSGGTCVSMWTFNAYQSDDIDLIPDGFGQRVRIREVMLALGFSEQNRYFVHPDTKLWFEFPSGPLVVGEERPREISEMTLKTGTLRLLSPTDCVKDRLTWWFHAQDRQCLRQALAVAQTSRVDIRELRRWSKGEHMATEFAKISDQFKISATGH